MLRALAVAHVVIAIGLMPLVASTLLAAPVFLIGPIWALVLARRMWRGQPGVISTLRRTHAAFLVIDAVMIGYGAWMLKAAAESAARGGGLLGGVGLIPILLGVFLALFSTFTLICTVALKRAAAL